MPVASLENLRTVLTKQTKSVHFGTYLPPIQAPVFFYLILLAFTFFYDGREYCSAWSFSATAVF